MDTLTRQERVLDRIEEILRTPIKESTPTNDIDLVVKYLQKHGTLVDDIVYYSEAIICTVSGTDYNIGVVSGYPAGKCFFFGHLQLDTTIGGVIVLTNANMLVIETLTFLKGVEQEGDLWIHKGVNHGMNLGGDGIYRGVSRYYGLGFNRMSIAAAGMGAATFVVAATLNGLMFTLK